MKTGKLILYAVAGLLALLVVGFVVKTVLAIVSLALFALKALAVLGVLGGLGYAGYKIYSLVSGLSGSTSQMAEATVSVPHHVGFLPGLLSSRFRPVGSPRCLRPGAPPRKMLPRSACTGPPAAEPSHTTTRPRPARRPPDSAHTTARAGPITRLCVTRYRRAVTDSRFRGCSSRISERC